MNQTVFIFGRTPELSFLELTSFYPSAVLMCPGVAWVTDDVEYENTQSKLGGTVKIAEVVERVSTISPESLLPILVSHATQKHLTFGISGYGGFHLPSGMLATLKTELGKRGIVARYVEGQHGEALSSVTITKQNVVEINVIPVGKEFSIAVTRAVQNFEDWSKRDFDRPAVDPKRGMLPPKVARMIVNISLGSKPPAYTPTLLDPFCGVGTILSEALFLGANVVGCDISESAIAKTKKNLEWLRREYPETKTYYAKAIIADATRLGEHITRESIDVVVTEPFLGKTIDDKDVSNVTPEHVKNTLKGLEKLYIGALREWVTLLKPKGRIVMAMPAYVTKRAVMRVKNVIDRCETLGYTLLTGPIEYSRPQAIVRREFYIFQKK